MDEFKGSRGFLYIPVAVARDKELLKNPKTILLIGEIVSMLNVTGKFYMSNSVLAKKLDTTVRSVRRYLNILEERGYIKRTLIYADDDSKQVKGRLITAGPTLASGFNGSWDKDTH